MLDLTKDEYVLLGGEGEGTRWTWSTVLYPQSDGTTRLVTRNTGDWGSSWTGRLMLIPMDLAAFIMVRRWLQVLKGRAEQLHRQGMADGDPETETEELAAAR